MVNVGIDATLQIRVFAKFKLDDCARAGLRTSSASLPGLTRQSISLAKKMDPRVEPAGDHRGFRTEDLLLVAALRHRSGVDRERRARAFGGVNCGTARRGTAAGEVAISKMQARERATEALGVGPVDVKAGLEGNAIHRRAGLLTLRPHGPGGQNHKTDRPAAAELHIAGNRAVAVDPPGAARAFKACEGEKLAGHELPRCLVIELLSRR